MMGRTCQDWNSASQASLQQRRADDDLVNQAVLRHLSDTEPRKLWQHGNWFTAAKKMTSIVLTGEHVLGIDNEQKLVVLDVTTGDEVSAWKTEENSKVRLGKLYSTEGGVKAIDSTTGEWVSVQLADGKLKLARLPSELEDLNYRVSWTFNPETGKAELHGAPKEEGRPELHFAPPEPTALHWWHLEYDRLYTWLGDSVRSWDLDTGKKKWEWRPSGNFDKMSYRVRGGMIHELCEGYLNAQDLETFDMRQHGPALPVTSDRMITIDTSEGKISLWNWRTGEYLCDLATERSITAATLMGLNTLITGDRKGKVTFWDLEKEKELRTVDLVDGQITTLLVQDGRLYVSTWRDHYRAVFDLRPLTSRKR